MEKIDNLLTKESFNDLVLNSKDIILVDFYADWCGPCKMLSPIMEEIAKEYVVYKVNVDDESELAREYGIMSIPCVIVFKEGKEINRSIGLKSKDEILDLIK